MDNSSLSPQTQPTPASTTWTPMTAPMAEPTSPASVTSDPAVVSNFSEQFSPQPGITQQAPQPQNVETPSLAETVVPTNTPLAQEPTVSRTAPDEMMRASRKKNPLIMIGLIVAMLGIVGSGIALFALNQQTQPLIVTESQSEAEATIDNAVSREALDTNAPLAQESQIPPIAESTPIASPSPVSTTPSDWQEHQFINEGITLFAPKSYSADSQFFPTTNTKLIRLWQGSTAETATIQLDIKPNWENTGAESLPRTFAVNETLLAAKVEPPKMEEQKLDRYQTNYYFEHNNQVYVFMCVHNWIEQEYRTCEGVLQSLQLN